MADPAGQGETAEQEPNEREPVFVARAKVYLDGQEWPPTATENVEAALRATLLLLVADKEIISFELVVE